MKGLATLAELFTVMAILFLLQTVLNFAASTQNAAEDAPRNVVLTISQVPSDNEYVDHIRFLQIGEHLLLFQPAGCRSSLSYNSISPISLGSIFTKGQCFAPSRKTLRALDPSYPGYEQEFIERVHNDYQIRVSISSGFLAPDKDRVGPIEQLLPKQITVAYTVKELPRDQGTITLSVGYCLCTLGITPASLQALPIWNIGGESLPYPHPLVIRVTSLDSKVTTVRDLSFHHNQMKQLEGEDIIRTGAGRVEMATLFREPNCPTASGSSAAVFSSRDDSLRQYSISLRDL